MSQACFVDASFVPPTAEVIEQIQRYYPYAEIIFVTYVKVVEPKRK